ncbi:MAG: aspartate aminotransferase family protein [Nitrospiraceae bacterium]|nr:aspartate aminotransferase family protein [Nitrospiraceae bacterium]MDA8433849.1 aspartate aminotransferase family protein [Nitrospiraceae bacterium]
MADHVMRAKGVLTNALVIHTDILAKKADRIYIEDINGKRYMDFTSGLATTNIGHNHPAVVGAIRKQAEAVIHSGCIFYYEPLLLLAEKMREVTPPGLDMFFFANSGAEAVEGALKLARFSTGRQGIVAFTGGFHGRTFGAMSLTTSSMRYRRSYQPFVPSVYHSPYPYCFRCFFGQRPATCGMDCYTHLERLFKHLIPPDEVACIVIEPVLGEGGYVVPPKEFLKKLRELCNRWNILLILDEVQAGMGRTGRWFASEHFGVVPDIMTVAKGIASGMPLSAIASTKEIMEKWPKGAHGTTFGGNPVSCAAAIATIEVMQKEDLLENAQRAGEHALKRLRGMQKRFSALGDVRGLGLMIGIEFVREGDLPDTEGLRKVMDLCLEKGLILLECGVDKNIIRFCPPLSVKIEELDAGLDILESALKAVYGGG